MKKLLQAAIDLKCVDVVGAQENEDIILPEPRKDRGCSVMKALAERVSIRECSTKDLSLNDLSDLLWAANGINRSEDGRRTAPSALNKQDIDIYVFTDEAVYLYNPVEHSLVFVKDGDNRYVLAGPPSPARCQDFVKDFPLILLYVSDLSRFGMEGDKVRLMAALDAGIVSQNVSLFCSAVKLATVPRMSMDLEAVKEILELSDNQIPLMNNPVGYIKE